jgi:hypothetical protein
MFLRTDFGPYHSRQGDVRFLRSAAASAATVLSSPAVPKLQSDTAQQCDHALEHLHGAGSAQSSTTPSFAL